jgi:hypothetical protein
MYLMQNLWFAWDWRFKSLSPDFLYFAVIIVGYHYFGGPCCLHLEEWCGHRNSRSIYVTGMNCITDNTNQWETKLFWISDILDNGIITELKNKLT